MGAETQEPKDAGQAAAATGFKIELSQHCGRDCAIDLNSFSNIFNSDLKYLFCCWGVGSVIIADQLFGLHLADHEDECS